MSEGKRTPGPANRPRAASYLDVFIVTTTFACLIGLIDFALYELWGHPSRVLDYVLYKPTFVSFSSLLIHLTVFSAVACFLLGIFIALRYIMWRLTKSFIGFLPLATLSTAVTGLSLISLRLLKESPSISRTVLLLASVALGSVISLAVERHLERSTPQTNRVTGPAQATMFVVSATIFVVAFLAPDLNTLFRATAGRRAPQPPQRPNVVLIVLDTVRADRLSCYGNTTISTPNIDRLARGGLLFLNAFATAPWTVPSHASMFTGLYPSQHQATWDNTSLHDEFVTLAERLGKSGYACAGFSENPFVGIAGGFAQGFTEFHETWRRPLLERAIKRALGALGRRDHYEHAPRTTSLLAIWLSGRRGDPQPFFGFVNLMAAHLPNYPRDEQGPQSWPVDLLSRIEPVNRVPERHYIPQYRLNEAELAAMSHIYDQQIRYLDVYVGRIIDHLAERGLLDNTLFVLTSDHGENFGEHGFIEHQFCLYNTLIHVPLILHFPNLLQQKAVRHRVSTVALMDTVLDLTNCESKNPTKSTTAIPLHMTANDQVIVAQYTSSITMLKTAIFDDGPDIDYNSFDRNLQCIILNDFKYVWSSKDNHELYSMSTDPAEEHNLIESSPETARKLFSALTSWQGSHQSSASPPATLDVDPATRDALRALGYER